MSFRWTRLLPCILSVSAIGPPKWVPSDALMFDVVTPTANGSDIVVSKTMVELQTHAVGRVAFVETSTPFLRWTLENARKSHGVKIRITDVYTQHAYRIISHNILTGEREWDSGWVVSDETVATWGGRQLDSNMRIAWQVLVMDGHHRIAHSDVGTFHIALMHTNDWSPARWISVANTIPRDNCSFYSESPTPYMRTEFMTPSFDTNVSLEFATVHVVGLGWYRLYINGKRVGDHELDPALSNYNRTILYSSYDVTEFVHEGEVNAIGIQLGNGWWNQLPFNLFGRFHLRSTMTTGPPRALMRLSLHYSNGTIMNITTSPWEVPQPQPTHDGTSTGTIASEWMCTDQRGPWTHNNVYLGDAYDASRENEITGWSSVGFTNLHGWTPCVHADDAVVAVEGDQGTFSAPIPTLQYAPPVRKTAEWRPIAAWALACDSTTYVLDFGQELTGWVEFNVTDGTAGGVMDVVFAERLNASQNIFTDMHTHDASNVVHNPKEHSEIGARARIRGGNVRRGADIDATSTFAGGMGRWCAPGSGCEDMWGDCVFSYPPTGRISGEQAITYTMKGTRSPAVETYQGAFSFHVFRYVRIRGYPTPRDQSFSSADNSSNGDAGVLDFLLQNFVAQRLHTDNAPSRTLGALPSHAQSQYTGSHTSPIKFSTMSPYKSSNSSPDKAHTRTDGGAASFVASVGLLNEIDALAAAAFRSNWIGIQSDCPGRERLGYGGDMMTSSEAGMYLFDAAAFYTKRAQDYADARRANGGLPETAPYMGIATCDTLGSGTGPMQWGAALVHTLHMLYMHTNDTRAVRKHFDTCVQWMDLLNHSSPQGVLHNGLRGFTDTGADGKGIPCNSSEVSLMGTAFLVQQASLMATLARVMGRAELSETYRLLAKTTTDVFNLQFFNLDSFTYGDGHTGSHNDMVYALGLGLVPEQFVQPVLAALLHSLDGNNTFVVDAFGVWLLPQLVELGAGEAVMDWMLSEAYPSYGFFVRNNIVNATTMMEHWDTPMENDSHNHAWLNSVALFYRTRLLGIVPQTPGWETTRIRAWPLGRGQLTWVNGFVTTIKGTISVAWNLSAAPGTPSDAANKRLNLFVLEVHVPATVVANVYVPVVNISSTAEHCSEAVANGTEFVGDRWWMRFTLERTPTCWFRSNIRMNTDA